MNPLAVRTNAATPAALRAVSFVSLYLIPVTGDDRPATRAGFGEPHFVTLIFRKVICVDLHLCARLAE